MRVKETSLNNNVAFMKTFLDTEKIALKYFVVHAVVHDSMINGEESI